MKVILASKSPRRIELLGRLFEDFEIMPAEGEEKSSASAPDEYVCELAASKAKEIEDKLTFGEDEEYIIIGADTVVAKDATILGKPKDKEDAREMISSLQDGRHQVYTGVSLIVKKSNGRSVESFAMKTEVAFNKMDAKEIDDYIEYKDASGAHEWADKAGAYAIQGYCARFIEGIYGDYYNVVGFPIAEIYKKLHDHNML